MPKKVLDLIECSIQMGVRRARERMKDDDFFRVGAVSNFRSLRKISRVSREQAQAVLRLTSQLVTAVDFYSGLESRRPFSVVDRAIRGGIDRILSQEPQTKKEADPKKPKSKKGVKKEA